MKNSDLKRFFETDASNNNDGFARLNPTGALNAPVSSNKISTGNAANGMLMAADGHGGVKFVEQGGGGSDPYVTTFGRFIDYYPVINGEGHDMLDYIKSLNPYPNKTIAELKQELAAHTIIEFGIAACATVTDDYSIVTVDFKIDENKDISEFYIDVGEGEEDLTEYTFTDENTINDVIAMAYQFIAATSVNPHAPEDNLNYPIVCPVNFYEYGYVINGETKIINNKAVLQVTNVAALLEEHHE